jgi:hypothetical protein
MLRDYIENGGSNCIYCQSDDLEGGFVEIDSATAYQPIRCNNCAGSWDDRYELTGVTSFEPEREPLNNPEQLEQQVWETYRAAALSVEHLDRAGCQYLDWCANSLENNRVMKRDTGWFIKLSGYVEKGNDFDDVSPDMPKSVQDIIKLAVAQNINMVEIDADAPTLDTLPTFDDNERYSDAPMTTVPYSLLDLDGDGNTTVKGTIEVHPRGIKVSFDDHISATDDAQVFIENYDSETRVVVWADEFSEDPSHVIIIPRI